MKTLTQLVALIAITLTLASCGGGGSDADAELAEALAASWDADDDFPEGIDTACLAAGFIEGIGGADGAAEYDVDKDNIGDDSFDDNPLSEDDALAAAEAMFGCDRFKALFIGDIANAEGEDADCLADELSDEPLTALLASGFMNEEDSRATEDEYENAFEEEYGAGLVTCEIGQ